MSNDSLASPEVARVLSDYQIRRLFTDRSFIGDVLRCSTLLEYQLDCALCQYFVRADRVESAMNDLLPEIALGRKLQLIEALPMRRSITSHKRAVAGLKCFQRLRNTVAHNIGITHAQLSRLLAQPDCKRVLSTYPGGMILEYRNTTSALGRLLRTREFRNPHSPSLVDWFTLSIDKLF